MGNKYTFGSVEEFEMASNLLKATGGWGTTYKDDLTVVSPSFILICGKYPNLYLRLKEQPNVGKNYRVWYYGDPVTCGSLTSIDYKGIDHIVWDNFGNLCLYRGGNLVVIIKEFHKIEIDPDDRCEE